MNQPVLHKTTANQLAATSKNLPHAVLLAGPSGVGLLTIAKNMAKSLASQFLVIAPDEKGTIGIEIVRELYTKTRTKQTQQQIIIIDDADAMSLAAQNAFLKLLEEPTRYTSFLLTSHAAERLLGTVRSRTQLISIQAVTPAQTEQYLNSLKVSNARQSQQLKFIAAGLPAELFRLISDEAYFSEQASLARTARQFLSSKHYDRLILVHRFGNSREQASQLLEHVMRILKYSLEESAKQSLALQLDKTLKAAELIKNNGHIRTQLLRLALGL